MGLKINENFVDEVFIKVNATGAAATGLTTTCTIIDESDNRVAGTTAETSNGWYKVTDFTPDAAGLWKLEWEVVGSPENYTVYGAFKIFKVAGGQEGDIQGAGFDATTESLVKLHDDHITEISAVRMAELDAANLPTDISDINTLATAIKAKTDNLPVDPADDSDIDAQLVVIDGLHDVPAQDTADNNQVRDVVGNKTDTTGGNSLMSLLKTVDAKVTYTPPSTIYDGDKDVTTAGVPETLAASQALTLGVVVQAKEANTGYILVGNATPKIKLVESCTPPSWVFIPIANLATVYVDSEVDGEGVNYMGV